MSHHLKDKYEIVIGLEVHAQLKTQSKAFAPDPASFGDAPNTNISVITLAHPGSLPKANEKMVEFAIKMGLACGSSISTYTVFDRKNYFYPDLPKGYQISQDKSPICVGGHVGLRNEQGYIRKVQLHHIHMEEDAGKSIHTQDDQDTLVDFNRAGVPLIEIVTEPDMSSSEEAYLYLQEIRRLVRYLDICDGNMEEGSLRCDANVSVRLKGAHKLGTRVEVKNMNSIRNVKRAIDYEALRQMEMVEQGISFQQETRTFDANSGKTFPMRAKETLNDYRYFPDPDLTPIQISEAWLQAIKSTLPPLPEVLFKEFTESYQLSPYDANILSEDKDTALYFRALTRKTNNYKAAANWMTGDIRSYLNEHNQSIRDFILSPSQIAALIQLINQGKISNSLASQKLFPLMLKNPDASAEDLAQKHDLIQEQDTDTLQELIQEVLAEFPDKVKAFHKGKKGLQGMFMGQIMKKSKGKADPKLAGRLLAQALAAAKNN